MYTSSLESVAAASPSIRQDFNARAGRDFTEVQTGIYNMEQTKLVLPMDFEAWAKLGNAHFGGLTALPQSTKGWTSSLERLSTDDLETETLPETAVGA